MGVSQTLLVDSVPQRRCGQRRQIYASRVVDGVARGREGDERRTAGGSANFAGVCDRIVKSATGARFDDEAVHAGRVEQANARGCLYNLAMATARARHTEALTETRTVDTVVVLGADATFDTEAC